MTHKAHKFVSSAVLAIGTLIATSGAVSAQGDLYYMHNASAYYIWSDRNTCEHDLRSSGNSCEQFGNSNLCGIQLYSTQATLNVAISKSKRNEDFAIRNLRNNSVFCELDN
jgi:hypothetical protein